MKLKRLLIVLMALPAVWGCNVDNEDDGKDGGLDTLPVSSTEYVDLGLPSGNLWATCNVGATNPIDVGDYFAHGETVAKEDYSKDNYKWYDGSDYTKYLRVGDRLTPQDDAAYDYAGHQGRHMPTIADWEELKTNTTLTYCTVNNVNCMRFTSLTDDSKYILVPAGGYIDGTEKILTMREHPHYRYRCADTNLDYNNRYFYSDCNVIMFVNAFFDSYKKGYMMNDSPRYLGVPIRPVYYPESHVPETSDLVKKIYTTGATDVKVGTLPEGIVDFKPEEFNLNYEGLEVRSLSVWGRLTYDDGSETSGFMVLSELKAEPTFTHFGVGEGYAVFSGGKCSVYGRDNHRGWVPFDYLYFEYNTGGDYYQFYMTQAMEPVLAFTNMDKEYQDSSKTLFTFTK